MFVYHLIKKDLKHKKAILFLRSLEIVLTLSVYTVFDSTK